MEQGGEGYACDDTFCWLVSVSPKIFNDGGRVIANENRNAMEVQFSEELRGDIERWGRGLVVQGRYKPEKEIEEEYLKGKFGNAYDFDQQERLDVVF